MRSVSKKNGMLSIDQRLSEVLVEVLHLAKNMNLANVMFVMGSHGFYCHGKPIENVSETIANLSINNRPEFNWLTKLGFTATGITAGDLRRSPSRDRANTDCSLRNAEFLR